MNTSGNLRNLMTLSGAIKRAHLPRLFFYAAANRLYRSVRVPLCRQATFDFAFGSFQVRANCGDLGTIGEIFVEKPYRAVVGFVPRDGDTCIDVGANIGCVSLQWRLTNPTGRIIAVEPHPATFARMERNFRLNQVLSIEAVHAAAGSRDGTIDITIDGEQSMARVPGGHLSEIGAFERGSSIAVPCVTIDTLLAQRNISRVDLLKIDVEGFEVEVLRGAARALTVTDRVVLEFHSADLKNACAEILGSLDFTSEVRGQILFARRAFDGVPVSR